MSSLIDQIAASGAGGCRFLSDPRIPSCRWAKITRSLEKIVTSGVDPTLGNTLLLVVANCAESAVCVADIFILFTALRCGRSISVFWEYALFWTAISEPVVSVIWEEHEYFT